MTQSKVEAMDEQPPQNHCLSLAQKRRAASFQAAATVGCSRNRRRGLPWFHSLDPSTRLLTYVDAYNIKERELQSCREVGVASLTFDSVTAKPPSLS